MTKKTRSNPLKNPKIKTTKQAKLFKPGHTPPAGCTCDPFEPDVEHQETCALSREEFPPVEAKPGADKPAKAPRKASHDMTRQAKARPNRENAPDHDTRDQDGHNTLSMLDAAHSVLIGLEPGQGKKVKDIYNEIIDAGLWTSPRGKTPANTLAAAMGTEIKKKGEHSRFVKVGRGLFKAA